jgi:hypothetical protein
VFGKAFVQRAICQNRPSMRSQPFSKPTLLAAVDLLDSRLSQARFNQLLIRLGMEDIVPLDTNVSVAKKAALLAKEVVKQGAKTLSTLEGSVTLTEAVVREAVRLMSEGTEDPKQKALLRGLEMDGYVVTWQDDGSPLLRASLPESVDLPAADDEIHQLLRRFNFQVPLGHLDQAIEAHTRGDWAAANSQARTFMESMLDAIALHLDHNRASALPSSENRRALLAEMKFLSVQRNEWTQDGKNFINGLFKMLHSDGSHPGLSDEDHSTFRLHLVLITARAFLRRLRSL